MSILIMALIYAEFSALFSHLVDDGIQSAEQQEASPSDQVLPQRHHVTLLLVLVPRLGSLCHGAA